MPYASSDPGVFEIPVVSTLGEWVSKVLLVSVLLWAWQLCAAGSHPVVTLGSPEPRAVNVFAELCLQWRGDSSQTCDDSREPAWRTGHVVGASTPGLVASATSAKARGNSRHSARLTPGKGVLEPTDRGVCWLPSERSPRFLCHMPRASLS